MIKYRHYRIFERDQRQFSTEFFARQIDEEHGDVLLQGPSGHLYYVNQFTVEQNEFCPLIYEIRCESWSYGTDFDKLVKNARHWFSNVLGYTPALLVATRPRKW
jgi:hypothetical protein